MAKRKDPKKGTGKKPKGSGRRLYTDENPRDTVRVKYATPADARKTVAKVKKVNKPFARKIQILTVVEQRAKVAGKPKQAAIAKKGKEKILKRELERNLKAVADVYTQMKILAILFVLNTLLLLMLGRPSLKLRRSTNHLLGRYRYLLWWNKELKLLVNQNKQR